MPPPDVNLPPDTLGLLPSEADTGVPVCVQDRSTDKQAADMNDLNRTEHPFSAPGPTRPENCRLLSGGRKRFRFFQHFWIVNL